MALAPVTTTARRALSTQTAPRGESRPTRVRLVSSQRKRGVRVASRRRVIVVLGVSVVAMALLVVAASQAMVASQQVRLDNLNQQLASAVAKNENLQLEKAQLATPSRILQISEKKLGMIAPTNVVYLSPVDVGPTLGSLSADASK